MGTAMTTREQAAARVERAMGLTERAQQLVEEAAAELSAVVGGAGEWRRVAKLYDELHAQWYRLERLRANPRLELDGCAAPPPAPDLGTGPGGLQELQDGQDVAEPGLGPARRS